MNSEEFRDAITEMKSRIFMPDVLAMYGIKVPRNHKIPCVFHNEKTASMHIYNDHYHCFGCGAHGDILEFVMHQEGINKFEAYLFLGGEVKSPSTARKQFYGHEIRKSEKDLVGILNQVHGQVLVEVNRWRQEFQEAPPFSDSWEAAHKHLMKAEQELDYLEEEIQKETKKMYQ